MSLIDQDNVFKDRTVKSRLGGPRGASIKWKYHKAKARELIMTSEARNYFRNLIISFNFVFFIFLGLAENAQAKSALNPELIVELKRGYTETCVPTIVQQLKSIGYDNAPEFAKRYCECLGTLYFNDFTRDEYDEMRNNSGGELPRRVAENRKELQEYCAEIHL